MGATRRRAHEEPSGRHLSLPEKLQLPLVDGRALVSNVGTWMQRVAQDWLVLTQLTHHDASALGIVMGLQFAPNCCCPGLDRLRTASISASS